MSGVVTTASLKLVVTTGCIMPCSPGACALWPFVRPFGGHFACEPKSLATGSTRFTLLVELLSPEPAESG